MALDDDKSSSGGESGGYDSGVSDSGIGEGSGTFEGSDSGIESGGNFDFSDSEIDSDGVKFDFDASEIDTAGDKFDFDYENLEMSNLPETEESQEKINPAEINYNSVVGNDVENKESVEHQNEILDINSQLSEIRGYPQDAEKLIGKDTLKNRIEKDTTVDKDADMSSRYIDITRAKGFLQEEMIKSTLINDFEVSEHTVKSVHNDGTVTYTDIEAVAKHNLEINGGLVISAGEKIAIESKAGNEKYIASQIEHIDKQLQGMPDDSHRLLFITADVNRLNDEDRARLENVLQKNNASMNVVPYYAYDLTDTIMHMRIDTDVKLRDDEFEEIDDENQATFNSDEKLSFGGAVEALFGSRTVKGNNASESVNESINRYLEGDENTQPDADERESLIAKEEERLEADRETVKRLLEENKELSELSDEERAAVLNVAIVKAMEHDPSLSLDKAEDYRSKIQFVTLSEVAKDIGMDLNYARRIQGYYSPEGGMRINVDAYGSDTDEALVTIEHEAIHMLAQRYDSNDKAIPGMTGLKNNKLSGRANNTGMNEGVTEMYASRDMSELLPDRQERSYVREVKVMTRYESIVGADILHEAYMKSGVTPLKEDFDKYMGERQFDNFCIIMDIMLLAEENRDGDEAEDMHQELNAMMDEYAKRKENNGNENSR